MKLEEIKILISDDSILMRKKLRDTLLEIGCGEVLEATDGQEAIEIYKVNRPHLVFMDIVMPVKTGIEAVSEIVTFDPGAKVIMASSVGTKNKLKEAIKAGALDFLQKPIDEVKVKQLIEYYLQ